MLTVAPALDFFVGRCILAVIAAVVLMLRNRAAAGRVATLFFVCHSGSPLLHKANRADGLDLAVRLGRQPNNVAMSLDLRTKAGLQLNRAVLVPLPSGCRS